MLAHFHKKPREADFFKVCNECANSQCCVRARPPLTKKRMRIIANFLKKRHIPLSGPFGARRYAFPRVTSGGYCIFFNKATKRCLIHPVKPETCVAAPFTFNINRRKRKMEWFLKKNDSCPLAGQLCRERETYRKHMNSAKHELRQLVRDLDAQALRAVLTVDEPETFKVGEDSVASSVLTKLRS